MEQFTAALKVFLSWKLFPELFGMKFKIQKLCYTYTKSRGVLIKRTPLVQFITHQQAFNPALGAF
ncbi:hypothetical protein SAMN05421832_10580 [Psychrobacillus psychrodurans]|nr:hypothetical protein SAMN05421832_10580 [Psychrobacillus psychrodurans]